MGHYYYICKTGRFSELSHSFEIEFDYIHAYVYVRVKFFLMSPFSPTATEKNSIFDLLRLNT